MEILKGTTTYSVRDTLTDDWITVTINNNFPTGLNSMLSINYNQHVEATPTGHVERLENIVAVIKELQEKQIL